MRAAAATVASFSLQKRFNAYRLIVPQQHSQHPFFAQRQGCRYRSPKVNQPIGLFSNGPVQCQPALVDIWLVSANRALQHILEFKKRLTFHVWQVG